MEPSPDVSDLNEAVASCTAALASLETARDDAVTGSVYPTHLHLAVAELAQTIESVMRAVLRQ